MIENDEEGFKGVRKRLWETHSAIEEETQDDSWSIVLDSISSW